MPAIAIVGMACRYADANTPRELWENILARRRAFRRMPEQRLNLADYYSADPSTPDAIYATEVAVIEGYEFDRMRFRVAGDTYRSTDLTHWLALDMADQALRDAGFAEGHGLPVETTGVLLGNTLTGEFSRASTLRLRWPYVSRLVEAQLLEQGLDTQTREVFIAQLKQRFLAPFAPVGEETLAGGLSNTIAGRICNHFHLNGGGYTLDGACSSSLLAIANACAALDAGDLDVAIAGGVDLSLDPFELVGFAKTGALAKGEMRVYDRDSNGFIPGEGCGMVVLMRHDDALAHGLRSYAVIRGWGISSDGGGGITRPESNGQRLALQRAYRRAGYGIDSVTYFEGHGTGTTLGDEVELRTLMDARRDANAQTPAAIGSIKANIGHTKAAAGAAGLIKTSLALHCQLLPPNSGLRHPHKLFQQNIPLLRVLDQGEPWPTNQPLRAGVSGFGFGGIDVHLTLEGLHPVIRRQITPSENTLLASPQDAELYLLSAPDATSLAARIDMLKAAAPRLSYAEMADLSNTLITQSEDGPFRAAVVASSPHQLHTQLTTLHDLLANGVCDHIDQTSGILLGTVRQSPRIALLFPGQAAPVFRNGGAWAKRYPELNELYQTAKLPPDVDTHATALAQPAIIAAELAAIHMLNKVGIQGDLAIGNSLGELAALHWAGAMNTQTLQRLTSIRGKIMADVSGPAGAMASLAAAPEALTELLKQHDLTIAGFNGPRQTVVSGPEQGVNRLVEAAHKLGITATRLPVSHAFHSPLMQPAGRALAAELRTLSFAPLHHRVSSTVTGNILVNDADLRTLLTQQLTTPVRFSDAIRAVQGTVDLYLEAGPGHILTTLTSSLDTTPCIPLDASSDSLKGLWLGVAAAYVMGATLNRQALCAGRFTRQFPLDWQPTFFASPCEQAPRVEKSSASAPRPAARDSADIHVPDTKDRQTALTDPLELVRHLVADRAEFPITSVHADSRLLLDLHLNSITVGQLVGESARRLGLTPPVSPTDFAGATVAQIAEALQDMLAPGSTDNGPDRFPAGVDTWVRAFTVASTVHPLPDRQYLSPGEGKWQLFSSPSHPLARAVFEALGTLNTTGVLVCLGSDPSESDPELLLAAARKSITDTGSRYFVLIQQGNVGGGFARTLHLESPGLTTCVLNMPVCAQSIDWAIQEIRVAKGYHEVHYNSQGQRLVPALELWEPRDTTEALPLNAEDLLLVSGGGKGIAAECAAALALSTGARLALLGRSSPEQDAELTANLARLHDKGIRFRYLIADVSNQAAVHKAVNTLQQEFGPVTAILHGAGINRPTLLTELSKEAMLQTLATKVEGARHLLSAVNADHLRLLIGFGSIIARTGMRGEADYALANEWLAHITEDWSSRHPHCRCLCIEWSVWSGLGMGERLGKMDTLLRDGITPISPEAGVNILQQLLNNPPVSSRVIVSGRFGESPTLSLNKPALPLLRFLEQPRVYYPGIELVVDVELSSPTDPYLEEHILQDERLFPAVMGMEAITQVAMALSGKDLVPQLEDIEFLRPVVLSAGQTIHLRLAALKRGPSVIDVVLRCSSTNFQADHFRARCHFRAPGYSSALPALRHAFNKDSLQSADGIYDTLLFHQGRFRRVLGYRSLSATQCVAEIDSYPHDWFAQYLPKTLHLGDPASRDAAIHAIQACIPQARLLPVGVQHWLPANLTGSGPWRLTAQERWHKDEIFCYDLELRDLDGNLREQWQGLRLRKVADIQPSRWPAIALAPYIERKLQALYPDIELQLVLQQDEDTLPRLRSDQALKRLLKDQLRIHRRSDGKPEVIGKHPVSTAHAHDLTLAISGKDTVACDLEPLTTRTPETWCDLLAGHFALATLIAHETQDSFDTAALRVWGGIECLKKAASLTTSPLVLEKIESDGWVILRAGELTITSYIANLQEKPQPYCLSLLIKTIRKPRCEPMNIATS